MRPLPMWVTVTVVLTLTALLAYNFVIVGPQGLPGSYLIGGLLGAYAGLDQYLKARGEQRRPPEPPLPPAGILGPPPPEPPVEP